MNNLMRLCRFSCAFRSGLVTLILILASLSPSARAVVSVTLAWDPSPDTSVIGYNFYYGQVSGSSTNKIDVGSALTNSVSGLAEGTTYFFFVTAYNLSRAESVPSNVINYTVPPTNNTPPTISNIPNQTISEDTATALIAFTVGDAETQVALLAVSGSSSNPALVPPGGIVFGGNGSNRIITLTPAANANGTATITVTVSDGQLSASTNFVLTVNPVNDPPTISSLTNRTINVNGTTGPIGFNVGDLETAVTSLSVSANSSNPTLVPPGGIVLGGSGNNRTLTVTPAGGQSGAATITVTVNDGVNSTSSTFGLMVNVVNTTPTISNLANQTVNEDTATVPVAFTVGDAETQVALLAVSGSSSNPALVPPGGIVFGGSGSNRTITLTPAANANGTATITVTVSDGLLSASTSFVLTVNPVNDPPTISSLTNRTINENGTTGPIGFNVGDLETAVTSLSVSANSSNPTLVPPGGIVFGGSGSNRTVTVTPAGGQSGAATLTVTVNDGVNSTSSTFGLTVNVVNTTPTISNLANQTVNEDTATVPVAFTVGDAETQAGLLAVSGSSSNPALVPPGGIVFGGSGSNRTITLTPAANANGTATITVTLSDGQLSASTNFVLTVNPVTDPPTIQGMPNQSIDENTSTGAISFWVNDLETQVSALTLSGSSSNPTLVPPGGIVFGGSGANRTVTITPATNQIGNATITIAVSDGSLTASSSFALMVNLPALVYLPFEAELATLVSPMTIVSDTNASQGRFIKSSTTDSGTATFPISIPRSDTYVVWCRILSPDSSMDSLYVSVDGGAEAIYTTSQNIWTDVWLWTVVNDSVAGVNPRTFQLGAGQHSLVVRGREAGTALDQILVTTDRNFVPDIDFTTFAPNNAIFPLVVNPNGSATISWPSVPGMTYRVQYKTRLSDPLWIMLKPDMVAAGTVTSRSDYLVGSRFYSVTLLP